MNERPGLRPKSAQLYEEPGADVRHYVVNEIRAAHVRKTLLDGEPGR
ncbi:hypothetical protein ACFY19_28950 [Streptosporangium saharense]